MSDNNQAKKRGRPRKILSPEEILAIKNKSKRGRGRPKKTLRPEEQQAVLNQVKRARGRPRKILTSEQVKEIALRKQRGRGRPKKKLTPAEEWMLNFSPQCTKGRPRKDYVATVALPRLVSRQYNFRQNSLRSQSPVTQLPNLSKNIIETERRKPKLSWQEFKEKLRLPDLADDFIFPSQERAEAVLKTKEDKSSPTVAGSPADELSEYILDLREARYKKLLQAKRNVFVEQVEPEEDEVGFENMGQESYAWNQSAPLQSEVQPPFLNFEVPDDAHALETQIELSQLPKTKKRDKNLKVNLMPLSREDKIEPSAEVRLERQKYNLINKSHTFPKQAAGYSGKVWDKFLIGLGRAVYFVWQILICPFKFLDWTVDRALKALWYLIKYGVNLLLNVLKLNFNYLKKLAQAVYVLFSVRQKFTPHQSLVVSALGDRNKIPQDRNPKPWTSAHGAGFTSQTVKVESGANKFLLLKPVLTFAGIALLIVLPIYVWRTWHKVSHLKGDVMGVSSQGVNYLKDAVNTVSQNNLSDALKQFEKAQNSFELAQAQVEELGKINSWLLNFVPQAKQGQELLRAGELASSIGQSLARALAIFNGGTTSQQICRSLPGEGQHCTSFDELNLTYKVDYLKNIFKRERPNIDELIQIIEQVDVTSLAKSQAENINLIKSNIYGLRLAVEELNELLEFLQEFLAADEPKRYLIVFQNSNEVRATGGFMGSFALVDVNKGNVQQMEIPGGGLYDLKASNLVAVEAPKPLQIFSPAWQIWNANWFPDWPTSAQKIKWFYENTTSGSSLDGVIALTQDVIEDLLKQTGPVEMSAYQKILTADNFIEQVQMAVELEYDQEQNKPKQIIADLAPILLERLINLDLQDSFDVLLTLDKALANEKILFYFSDEEVQQIVSGFGWSGEMKNITPAQDYLSVIHTNISGGKTDGVIDNKIQHRVEVQGDGSLLARVILTRSHQGVPGKLFESDNNVDYVRFYVPQGSEFVAAKGFNFTPSYLFKYGSEQNLQQDPTLAVIESDVFIDEQTGTRVSQEFGKTVFGNWIQVSPGESQTVEISYKLPLKFEQKKSSIFDSWLAALGIKGRGGQFKYSLILEKQPGANEIDFSSQFVLPVGWNIKESVASSELNLTVSGVEFRTDLMQDEYYGVVVGE